MKRILISLLVIALLLTTVFVLTGCEKEEVTNEEPIVEDNVEQESEEVEESEFSGPSDDTSAIVGDWKTSLAGYDYIYTFNEDGTGNYNAAGNDMRFSYKLKGDKIAILYEGDTVPFETTYSIDGDTLNVVDSMGEDTLYQKVK